MKMHFRKVPPKIISYRDFMKLCNNDFFSEQQSIISCYNNRSLETNFDSFFQVCIDVFDRHAHRKKKCMRTISKPFMAKIFSNK